MAHRPLIDVPFGGKLYKVPVLVPGNEGLIEAARRAQKFGLPDPEPSTEDRKNAIAYFGKILRGLPPGGLDRLNKEFP